MDQAKKKDTGQREETGTDPSSRESFVVRTSSVETYFLSFKDLLWKSSQDAN